MPAGDITQLLAEFNQGNKEALDQLLPLVYDELRRQARSFLSRERADHTLQATALVHEAYMRLAAQRSPDWQNRAQFFGLAVQEMRRILINYAERHHAAKRGGDAVRVPLDERIADLDRQTGELLALDEALKKLSQLDAQQGQIVEMHFFGGRTLEEIADALNLSRETVKRRWRSARAFLRGELSRH